jgi:MFS family permease
LAQGTAKGGVFGFRSLLNLYVAFGYGDISGGKTYFTWWMFITALSVLPILGGFLGDRSRKPVLATQIGAGLSFIAALIVTLGDLIPFYSALILFAIGTGLFDPNVKALFGRSMKEEERNMDAGWTLFFLFFNFFALTTPALPSYIGTEDAYPVSFAVMGVFPLLSLGLMTLFQYRGDHKGSLPRMSQKVFPGPYPWKWGAFLFFLLLSFIGAWTFYEWGMGRITYFGSIGHRIKDFYDKKDVLFFIQKTLPSTMTILFHLVLVAVWSFWKTSTLKKLGVGFLLFGFSTSFLVPELMAPGELGTERMVRYFVVFLALNAVFEALTTPSFYSLITRSISGKWLGTAFGAFSMLTIPVSRFFLGRITNADFTVLGTSYTFFFLFLIFAGAFFALDRWWTPFVGRKGD